MSQKSESTGSGWAPKDKGKTVADKLAKFKKAEKKARKEAKKAAKR